MDIDGEGRLRQPGGPAARVPVSQLISSALPLLERSFSAKPSHCLGSPLRTPVMHRHAFLVFCIGHHAVGKGDSLVVWLPTVLNGRVD